MDPPPFAVSSQKGVRPPSTDLKSLVTPPKDIKQQAKPVDHVRCRDRTNEYQQRRLVYREKLEKEMNSMLEILANLSLQKFAHSKQPIVPPKPKGPKLQKCARCEEPFEWSWWNLGEMRNICTLCGRTFCNSCGTSKVQLKSVSALDGEDKSEVQACVGCAEVVQSYYRRLQFEEMKRSAELNPIVNFYRDTTNLRSQVFFLIDRYADITSALSWIDASRFEQANTALENVIAAPQGPTTLNGTVSVSESIISSSTKFLKYLLPIGGFGPSPPPLTSTQSTKDVTAGAANSIPIADLKGKNSSLQSLAVSSTPTGDEPFNISSKKTNASSSLESETPETLYKMADTLEKDITKSLMTYNRCVKEMSEIVVDSVQENEIIKHIKNSSAVNIQEIALSLKMLKKRIVQIDFKLLKTVYNTLYHISNDLLSYAFCGVLKDPIDRCIEKLKEELKSKVESVSEPWDAFEKELFEDARATCVGSKIVNLPPSAPVKLQAQRVISVTTQLSNMAEFSICHDYVPLTISSLRALLIEAQQYS